jgi:hypothetical protein
MRESSSPAHRRAAQTDQSEVMRTIVLATGGALLMIGGVWTVAFTAIGSAEQPSVIGPAVVVGSTVSPSVTDSPSTNPTVPPGSTTEPGDDHGVDSVAPAPAVTVTDDHGGRRNGQGKNDK